MQQNLTSLMLSFFTIVTIIFTLAHIFIGRRIITPTSWPRWIKRVGWLAIVASMLIQLSGVLAYRGWAEGEPPLWLTLWIWTSYLLMGLTVLTMIVLLANELLRLGALARRLWFRFKRPHISKPLANPERRAFLGNAVSFGVLGSSSLLTGVGVVGARLTPTMEEVDIPIRGLPDALDGYRILQITDLHVGPTIKRPFIEDVVKRVGEIDKDLIVMTGDMIDGYPNALRYHLEPLAELRAPDGMLWTTGNHEYYWNVDVWMREAERLGFHVLSNSHMVIQRGEGKLVVAGVPDYNGGRFSPDQASNPAASLKGAPENAVRVLLAHQPRSCYAAAKAGFDLQLSGHTHGGQLIPWKYLVYLQQPYISGLHRHDNMWVYVSRGTGYWGPPVRLGVPSEISVLKLVSA